MQEPATNLKHGSGWKKGVIGHARYPNVRRLPNEAVSGVSQSCEGMLSKRRRFREHLCLAADHTSATCAYVRVPVDITSVDINHTSVESGTCLVNNTDSESTAAPSVPIPCGDFNNDPLHNNYLVDFMKNEFGLNYVQTTPTTLGNTTIDCTFTRNINVDILPYVSYLSYHRPMSNKIIVEY